MSDFTFRPAVRENVGLWINLIGGTGSGKTKTGMRLATGVCGIDVPFAVIDTENGRAKHYAPLPGQKADGKDTYNFAHCSLTAPFRPDAYADAVVEADKQGFPVIMIDSGSHVWAGDGGVLDWQEEELDRLAGSDYSKRERVKMSAWIKPKMGHKNMVQKLLQVKAHIILCLRAEEKIEMVKVNGKLEIQKKQTLTGKDGWIPICDKNLPFEATCSFLLLASQPGMPHPIKLQEQHKALFPLDKPITEESGQRLANWASGATKAAAPQDNAVSETNGQTGAPASAQSPEAAAAPYITSDQALALEAKCDENGIPSKRLLLAAKVERFSMIKSDDFGRANKWLDKVITEKATT